MKIAIAGASGLVGSALIPALISAGHRVFRLVRGRQAGAEDEIEWDPPAGRLDVGPLDGVEAIINLAGENIGARRWTAARRERILRSRVDATRTLVAAISELSRPPDVLLSASALGCYGDAGADIVTEASPVGRGFLPEVCRAWEAAAEGAARAGVRTVLMRFGLILTAEGGVLGRMLPLFRLGLGGRLGSGRQWMSWISIDDVVGVVQHALQEARYAGALNVVAPAPVTNAEFTRGLAREVRRPAVLPVPAWALRVAVGRQMADEALLASTRAEPQRLNEGGYAFRYPTLDSALRAAVSSSKR